MLVEASPVRLVVAFLGFGKSPGTWDMIRKAAASKDYPSIRIYRPS